MKAGHRTVSGHTGSGFAGLTAQLHPQNIFQRVQKQLDNWRSAFGQVCRESWLQRGEASVRKDLGPEAQVDTEVQEKKTETSHRPML